ncbi:MAG TPA: Ig-like domain repeat protein [Candidatus Sulfotelmatobacter sp.]
MQRHFLSAAPVVCVSLLMLGFAQNGFAQATPPLNFGNNYFVTGDYVVAGIGLRGLGVNGFATKQFTMPDANSVPAEGVPPGVDIVAAVLLWETVESSQTAFAGQNGSFRPVFSGGPTTGYPITGAVLGNPNAPVSWSSGGCSGSSQGSKTMRVYSADVLPFLPVDPKTGYIAANGTYEVRLADSGSNGGGSPLTLGASLIIIYRALTASLPLNSVVIYDGAFAPANGSSTMSQTLQGFYQAATNPISKLTHIVGNGQSNKFETVSLDGVNLPSLYGNLPSFPGYYNGSWDNPTWSFPLNGTNPIQADDASATTTVVPNSSNGGCVSWGAIIVGTTVQNSAHDGLLDVWKKHSPPGYCDASVNEGSCSTTDPSWVSLPRATPGEGDLFVQLDYMCSIVNANGSCNGSFYPSANALSMITNAFATHGITTHFVQGNAIQEPPACTGLVDPNGNPCPFPNVPGIVGWKAGLEFYKNQPLNYPDENSCEQALNGPCIRRFQHGKKDSYHYALFANAVGLAEWALNGGSLASLVTSGNTVTFTTSTPHGLTAGTDQVSIFDATTNPNLNGTYLVQTASGNVFTIQIPVAANGTYTVGTDPLLTVASGQVRTTSGVSDIGGADSLITLGLWGAAGQTDQVEAGTFMHELGHSIGLTHGGFYYDTANSYVATFEANCKPNYQSIMNYDFQVDLLDNGALDYSEQLLSTLNEESLPGGVTTTDGSPLAYSSTKWYTPVQPGGVGSPATSHCNGTPLSPNDPNPTMYHVDGPADPITPAWESGTDVNFDGILEKTLRGYNDWANIDLRQIGATGSDIFEPGAGFRTGTGAGFRTGTGAGFRTGTGIGNGDLNFATANSFARSPQHVTAAQTFPSRGIQVNWMPSTFPQIDSLYNIYRSIDGGPATKIGSVSGTSLTFTDTNVTCGPTYSYFVTGVLASTAQESAPSSTTAPIPSCAPTSTTVTSSADPSVFGQSVTFTAIVTNIGANTATPTGMVQFSVDGTPFGSVPLSGSGTVVTATSGATATLTVSGSPHTIKAVYMNADGSFSGSSGTLSQIVNPAPTSTTVTSTVNPSTFGQSIRFTATVTNTGGAGVSTATPTGSVQFTVDGVASGAAVTLSGAGATVTVTSSATATLTVNGSPHTIKAVYTNTDGNFSGSSGALGQIVKPAPTSTTVTSSLNPSIFGQSVTFTTTVTNTAGAGVSTVTPTGSVQFMDGASRLGSPQTLSGQGMASLTTSALAAGTHPITAVYSNTDGNFQNSTSGNVNQVVGDFSITATPGAETISSGHQAIYAITVTPISGLTGTIALSCSGVPANSTCSVSPSTDNLQGAPVNSTVTLSPSKNVDHGTFTLTFTGSLIGGNLTHSTTVKLTIQ